jgi:hypothetical protein
MIAGMKMKGLLFTTRTDVYMSAHLLRTTMSERPNRPPFGGLQERVPCLKLRQEPTQGFDDGRRHAAISGASLYTSLQPAFGCLARFDG